MCSSDLAKLFSSGMAGSISEMARWQSTQCVQVPDLAKSFVAELWQGKDDIGSMLEAAAEVATEAAASTSPVAVIATASIAEMGMTAAMAPEAGSHAIIQISTSLRNAFMFMGQA